MKIKFCPHALMKTGEIFLESQVAIDELQFDFESMGYLTKKMIEVSLLDPDPENNEIPQIFFANYILFCKKYGEMIRDIDEMIHISIEDEDDFTE